MADVAAARPARAPTTASPTAPPSISRERRDQRRRAGSVDPASRGPSRATTAKLPAEDEHGRAEPLTPVGRVPGSSSTASPTKPIATPTSGAAAGPVCGTARSSTTYSGTTAMSSAVSPDGRPCVLGDHHAAVAAEQEQQPDAGAR